MAKTNIQETLNRLERIVRKMDVPGFRRRNVSWLSKYMHERNASHPQYNEAISLVQELLSHGVANG